MGNLNEVAVASCVHRSAPMHGPDAWEYIIFRTIIMCQYKSCFNDFCRYNSIIIGEIKLNEVAVASCVHRSAPMHGPDAWEYIIFRTIIMCQDRSCFNDFCRYNSIIIGEI